MAALVTDYTKHGVAQFLSCVATYRFAGSDIAGVEAGAIEGAMATGAHAARTIAANFQLDHSAGR
jgi:hypothetical protein